MIGSWEVRVHLCHLRVRIPFGAGWFKDFFAEHTSLVRVCVVRSAKEGGEHVPWKTCSQFLLITIINIFIKK